MADNGVSVRAGVSSEAPVFLQVHVVVGGIHLPAVVELRAAGPPIQLRGI